MNITNLLKYCPKGTKLYSTAFGEVELIDTSSLANTILVQNNHDTPFTFYSDGSYILDGECILFPSKDQRDWSKFRLPLKRGDIMMKADGTMPFIASGEFYQDIAPKYICGVNSTGHFSTGIYGWTSEFYIPASEEAKKELFSKIAEAGYKWNADTLELEKIEFKFKEGDVIKDNKNNLYLIVDTNVLPKIRCVLNQDMKLTILDKVTTLASIKFTLANEEERNKFFSALVREGYRYDEKRYRLIKQEFKPFNKVLVRNEDNQTWRACLFSHYRKDLSCPYVCVGYSAYKQCIPYEGNEYLLGTTNYSV